MASKYSDTQEVSSASEGEESKIPSRDYSEDIKSLVEMGFDRAQS